MLNSTELRKGVIIELNEKLYQVIEHKHIKMKRTALVRLKLRDIIGGHTIEQTFQSNDRFKRARLEYRRMQYLYNDGGIYHFMDEENFEQIPLNTTQLGDAINFLKENMSLEISSYKDEIIGVELPITVELEVTKTDPGFKGNTATGGTKPAEMETGITIQVPLFVNEGDIIKVDTRNASYLERASQ
jgi:elongation factor P